MALATWALFAGLSLLLGAAGVFTTLIGVRAELDGFTNSQIGLVTAGYYAGFIVGSRLASTAIARVGHIRVYAALAAILTAAIVTSGMLTGPWWWLGLRFVAGACLAGQYVGAESWLNQLTTNDTRGRLLSIYLVVSIVAFGIGQVGFGLLDPEALTGFGIAAVLASLAVVPVALSVDAAPPPLAKRRHVDLREMWRTVPTGMVTSVLVGVTHGAFIGLGAVFATRAGLSPAMVGVFVAMPTVGNVLFSVPVGSASDRIDRRLVGIGAALVAATAALVLVQVAPGSAAGLVAMVVIGGSTYPLYSIAGAYTTDKIPPEQMNAVAGQLVLLYGVGAMIGPVIGSAAMAASTDGYLWTTVLAHVAIAAFLMVRVAQHPDRHKRTQAVPLDGTTGELPVTAGRR
ncbi:MAG TPA: MFS transporter [Ilumatobacter sp.]|nr:MFS transporter [Ilumatobacter sp.]